MITVFVVVFWFSIGMSVAMGAIGWALLRWKDLVTFWVMMITLGVVRGVLVGGALVWMRKYRLLDGLLAGLDSQMALVLAATVVAEAASLYGNYVVAAEGRGGWRRAAGWLVGAVPAVLLAAGGIAATEGQAAAGWLLLGSPTVAMLGGPLVAGWNEVFGRG